jgi:hypothetical protein
VLSVNRYEDFWINMENRNLCVGSGTRVGQATILCAHIPETAASAEQWTLGFGGSRHGRSTYFGIDNPVSMRQVRCALFFLLMLCCVFPPLVSMPIVSVFVLFFFSSVLYDDYRMTRAVTHIPALCDLVVFT